MYKEIFDETDGPIRTHQFSTYFCLRGPPFKYQKGAGAGFFFGINIFRSNFRDTVYK